MNIAWYLAPKEWKAFKKWHALACPTDELSSEERFVKEGGKLPKSEDKK
jgi:hypothetical protein